MKKKNRKKRYEYWCPACLGEASAAEEAEKFGECAVCGTEDVLVRVPMDPEDDPQDVPREIEGGKE